MQDGAPADVTTVLSIAKKKGGDVKAFAIRFLVVAALLLQLLPAWPAETIRIALIGGLSGPYALQDEEFLKNVQMAVDIVNTGGGVLGGKRSGGPPV
jgi:ABC-type branched-subunit amino acid transport system substrate-binding protein